MDDKLGLSLYVSRVYTFWGGGRELSRGWGSPFFFQTLLTQTWLRYIKSHSDMHGREFYFTMQGLLYIIRWAKWRSYSARSVETATRYANMSTPLIQNVCIPHAFSMQCLLCFIELYGSLIPLPYLFCFKCTSYVCLSNREGKPGHMQTLLTCSISTVSTCVSPKEWEKSMLLGFLECSTDGSIFEQDTKLMFVHLALLKLRVLCKAWGGEESGSEANCVWYVCMVCVHVRMSVCTLCTYVCAHMHQQSSSQIFLKAQWEGVLWEELKAT